MTELDAEQQCHACLESKARRLILWLKIACHNAHIWKTYNRQQLKKIFKSQEIL